MLIDESYLLDTPKPRKIGSMTFEVFKPIDIKMLVNLSDINPDIKNYEDSEIEKGTICQLTMAPNCRIDLGFFGPGGGKCYHSDVDFDNVFIEGTHFEVV